MRRRRRWWTGGWRTCRVRPGTWWRRITELGRLSADKEMNKSCGHTVYEVAGMGEVARGMVEQKADISLLVESRNTILVSNNK